MSAAPLRDRGSCQRGAGSAAGRRERAALSPRGWERAGRAAAGSSGRHCSCRAPGRQSVPQLPALSRLRRAFLFFIFFCFLFFAFTSLKKGLPQSPFRSAAFTELQNAFLSFSEKGMAPERKRWLSCFREKSKLFCSGYCR